MEKPVTPKLVRILVADDDPDDRSLIGLAFREANKQCKLEYVKDGEELTQHLNGLLAVNKISDLPDIILLDLNMPKKDGRTALQEIKGMVEFKDLEIIILSTSISDKDREFCMTNGASSCEVKPSEFGELLQLSHKIYNLVVEKRTLA